MRVAMIGTGYVGLVSGACFADFGHVVTCVDKDAAKVAALKRGDLVFWKGHIGIMRDTVTMLHANGWRMKVTSEPLTDAKTRIAAKEGGYVTSIRRL